MFSVSLFGQLQPKRNASSEASALRSMKESKVNLELETTRFVNIDKDTHHVYTNGQHVREIAAGEECQLIAYIAQVAASQLVDKILQEKGVKDSKRDTPERQSLFARILPEWAEKIEIKPLSPEEEKTKIDERITKQEAELAALKQEMKVASSKDEEIAELKKRLAKLEKEEKPKVAKK